MEEKTIMRSKQTIDDNRRHFATAIALVLLFSFCFTVTSSAQNVTFVSPLPGSSNVSQQTNIIVKVSGLLDRTIVSVPELFSVIGSSSGSHPGTTKLSDDHQTLMFQPSSPFIAGETVTVKTQQGLSTLQGNPVEPLEFTFAVNPLLTVQQEKILRIAAGQSTDVLTSSQAQAPSFSLAKSAVNQLPVDFPEPQIPVSANPSSGDIFMATFHMHEFKNSIAYVSTDEQYLMILDNTGMPVYYKPLTALSTDFKMQPNGHLTYYDGAAKEFFEMDSTYAVVNSYSAGNGYTTDVHELLLLPNGHALLLAQETQTVDMSKLVAGGNPAASVVGNIIQELDQNKNVVFQWRSFDYIPITDCIGQDLTAAVIDYIHSNALEVDTDGNILLSSRHTSEITKIDRQTGTIIWRWGGKENQFSFTNDPIGFSYQHSIRRTPTGTLMLFDDGNFHTPPFSRAVEYTMDEAAKTVTQVWQFRHSPDAFSIAMGSVQRLSNGNTLIGWGAALSPSVTEVRPDGSVALEFQLPDSVVSYRAFRFPWNYASTVTSVESNNTVPTTFTLEQNYPNPFNPTTVIRYTVPEQTNVSLKVYDMLGREVAILADGSKPSGSYAVQFDASRYSSGVYIYRLLAGSQVMTKKMTLLK
jgi:hypothetical protein